MKIRPGIELTNLTDAGCEHEENEDSFCYFEPENDEKFAKKGRLAVVADGMGGHEGGQVASHLAVEVVRDVYFESPAQPEIALLEAFQAAHEAIRQCAAAHPSLRGMGTTCTAFALRGGRLYFAHVGDSRLYRINRLAITRLTQDHSYVNQLVQEGVLRPEEAEKHPDRHILLTALGSDFAVPVEIPEAPLELQPEDSLLLCTDGLHAVVSEEEIFAVVTRKPEAACRELLQLAKHRGGPDNITLQIVRLDPRGAGSARQTDSAAFGNGGQP